MSNNFVFEVDNNSTPEKILVQLNFYFSVLNEYQLNDLQNNVREFVASMSNAIQEMDAMVAAEGASAQNVFESLFQQQNPTTSEESKDTQVEEPIELAELNCSTNKIWADVAKKLESFCRLEERLQPQIFTLIQSLNFEDIQSQRIEHALTAQKRLNEGMMKFLTKGFQNCTVAEVVEFANDLIEKTKKSYTMNDERKVFDQVFIKKEGG
ncbi:MAG: hypothetical protein V4591_11240 [Bdellovibrionota bacterium]